MQNMQLEIPDVQDTDCHCKCDKFRRTRWMVEIFLKKEISQYAFIFGWFFDRSVHIISDPSQQLSKEPHEEKREQMIAYESSIFVEGCILLNHLIPFGFLFHILLSVFRFFFSFVLLYVWLARKNGFFCVASL